jgi:hypothetical protein
MDACPRLDTNGGADDVLPHPGSLRTQITETQSACPAFNLRSLQELGFDLQTLIGHGLSYHRADFCSQSETIEATLVQSVLCRLK